MSVAHMQGTCLQDFYTRIVEVGKLYEGLQLQFFGCCCLLSFTLRWCRVQIREGREPGSVDEIGKEIAEVMLVVQVKHPFLTRIVHYLREIFLNA